MHMLEMQTIINNKYLPPKREKAPNYSPKTVKLDSRNGI